MSPKTTPKLASATAVKAGRVSIGLSLVKAVTGAASLFLEIILQIRQSGNMPWPAGSVGAPRKERVGGKASASDLELDADFHDLRARNLEIRRRLLGVAM